MKEIHSYHNEKQRRAQSENGQQDEECIEEVRERILRILEFCSSLLN
jgi:hypothetical protein